MSSTTTFYATQPAQRGQVAPRACIPRRLPAARHIGVPTAARGLAPPRWACLVPKAASSGADKGPSDEEKKHEASMEDIANELLASNPEAAARLKRLEEAAKRVADLQRQQAELDAQLRAAQGADDSSAAALEKQQAQSAAERVADAEVAAAAKLVEAAEMELLQARIDRTKWAGAVDESVEKLESGKAAAIAAAGGLAAGLPFALFGGDASAGPLSELLGLGTLLLTCLLFGVTCVRAPLPLTCLLFGVTCARASLLVTCLLFGVTCVRAPLPRTCLLFGVTCARASLLLTCLLFGVTRVRTSLRLLDCSAVGGAARPYRYALRQDVNNTQLKGGVVAAFGLARALGGADVLQSAAASTEAGIFAGDVIGKGLVFAGQSMLAVGFAAAAIEVALGAGVLKPFGEASEE